MDFFSNLNVWGSDQQQGSTQKPAEPGLFDGFTASATGLWDRFTNGVGDLGRGLSQEGFDGLKDLGGMMDRQAAARQLGAPLPKTGAVAGRALEAPAAEGLGMPLGKAAAVGGAALEAPAEQALEGLQHKTGPVVGSPLSRAAHHAMSPFARQTTPVAPDATPGQGWRKGVGGSWLPAGDAAAPTPTQYGLTEHEHKIENDQYFGGGAQRTKYYTPEERDAHALGAEDGLLRRADGSLMDTRAAAANLTSGGSAASNIFVAKGANVYAADSIAENEASRKAHEADRSKIYEATHHSSFLSGAKVDGAGEMVANEGWLKMVSNNSGHHKPGAAGNVQAIRALEDMGVNTDAALVHHIGALPKEGQSHQFYNARAFAASGGDTGLLDTHKSMFAQIHGRAAAVHAGKGGGKMSRDDVQDARGARDPYQRDEYGGPAEGPETAAAKRVGAERAEMAKIAAAHQPKDAAVSTASTADADQLKSGTYSERSGDERSTIDRRGKELSGWEADSYTGDQLHGMQLDRMRAKELEAAMKAAATAARAPAAPPQQYAPTQYAAAQQPAAPTAYLDPYAAAAAPAVDEKALRKQQKAQAKAARKAQKEAQRQGRIDARMEGDILGKHDEPVNASRADVLVDGWRRQGEKSLVPSPDADRQTRAWRRDSDAGEVAKAEPTASFKVDPHKTGHYANEFTSYIFGAGDKLPDARMRQVTKRFDDNELAERELHAEDGLLRRAHGGLMDTTSARATKVKGSDTGRNIFALAGDDVHAAGGKEHRQKLYASDVGRDVRNSIAAAERSLAGGADSATVEHTHHSSFNGAGELEGAGDMKVKRGWVQRVSNHSGHYEPDGRSNYQTLKALDKMGANLDATKVDHVWKDGDNFKSEEIQGRALLASGNDIDLVRAQKGMFDEIKALRAGKNCVLPSQLKPEQRGALPVRRSPERPDFSGPAFRPGPDFYEDLAASRSIPDALASFAD